MPPPPHFFPARVLFQYEKGAVRNGSVAAAAVGCHPSSPTRGADCAEGDLSGKHGRLLTSAVSAVFRDGGLPLFGPYSVVNHRLGPCPLPPNPPPSFLFSLL